MNTKLIEDVAAAVLYEGYLLYPYRASAVKNQQRWNFGVLYPRVYAQSQTGSDACTMQTECLLRCDLEAVPYVRVRFLHLIARTGAGQTAQGAVEREIALPPVALRELIERPVRQTVAFPPEENQRFVEATVEVSATPLADDLFRMRAAIFNSVECVVDTRDDALMRALVSTHTILSIDRGCFVSLLDPPDELRDAAAACRNVGTWPVLAGEDGALDAMLSSPIILYDYPKIALESPGSLFDGTEIDEILTLRILTLTDDEKAAMGQADERTRQILERTESMPPEQFMKMHGVVRPVRPAQKDAP